MYGYNAGQPMAIPIYTVLPYCVIGCLRRVNESIVLCYSVPEKYQQNIRFIVHMVYLLWRKVWSAL